ncbi:hypothetical protein ElyMa_004527000 [Elysia marginata]|uniref:Endonuclease/exonuclease/phosphatase domain-containing protein n=1 Tax=Elysia marginata TaxID=1093978 RepID=A0AAV4HQP4_9GAST|nr:hypothetical protein ElyMa_004527000 [Elysia marginata]
MTFNILQWNIRGLRANLEELLNVTKNCNIGIMAIQDSKLPEGWAPPRGFQLLSSEEPSRGASTFHKKLIKSYKNKLKYQSGRCSGKNILSKSSNSVFFISPSGRKYF